MKAIATYRRVSKKEQARDTEAYERQGWQLDREAAKYPERSRLIFEDIQSGGRDDRPDFLRLVQAINERKIDILIVTRIDRLSRNLEANANFQKKLQANGVRVYEILRGDFLNWDNPNDWSYFAQSGLNGELESRMLSARVISTFDWQRARGIMGGGRVGFPYKRNKEGYIIPDPENWDLGVKCIEIVLSEGGATMNALRQIRELGLNRTRVWLSNWIRSPLLRGHTPQNTRDDNGNVKSRKLIEYIPNTHQSIFSDYRLDGKEPLLDQIIRDSVKYKGQTKKKAIHPLSGLVYCARCGSPCHVKTINRKYIILMCSGRADRGLDCGGKYGNYKGRKGIINTRYEWVENDVIKALNQRAEELVNLAITDSTETLTENPKIFELREQIRRLESLNDPDLQSAINKKTADLNRLLAEDNREVSSELKSTFIGIFSTPEAFLLLSAAEKRILYQDWVQRIEVDAWRIKVILWI